MTTNRKQIIEAEAQRQKQYQKRIKALTTELEKISGPVLEFRRIEARMRELERSLASAREHNSAVSADFARHLSLAMPAELQRLIREASFQLGDVRSLGRVQPERIDNLAGIRRWLDEAKAAPGNPATTDSDLEALVERGLQLMEAEAVNV